MPATKKIEIEYGGGKKIVATEDEARDIYESLKELFSGGDKDYWWEKIKELEKKERPNKPWEDPEYWRIPLDQPRPWWQQPHLDPNKIYCAGNGDNFNVRLNLGDSES